MFLMRLLLLSNSTNFGGGYLDHAESEITGLFSGVKRILFVPFALHDQPGYWDLARDHFESDRRIFLDRLASEISGAPRSRVASKTPRRGCPFADDPEQLRRRAESRVRGPPG